MFVKIIIITELKVFVIYESYLYFYIVSDTNITMSPISLSPASTKMLVTYANSTTYNITAID